MSALSAHSPKASVDFPTNKYLSKFIRVNVFKFTLVITTQVSQ